VCVRERKRGGERRDRLGFVALGSSDVGRDWAEQGPN
jgi:hypothetical protein